MSATSAGERLRRWLALQEKIDDEDRRKAEEAISAFERIVSSAVPTAADIEMLQSAAASRKKFQWETAGDLIEELPHYSKHAEEIIRQILHSDHFWPRLIAMASLTTQLSREFRIKVIEEGLRDESRRVRTKAAERAEEFGLTELTQDLAEAQRKEEDPSTASGLQLHLDLLRDGYQLGEPVDGGQWIALRTETGVTCEFVADDERAKFFERLRAEGRRVPSRSN